MPPITVELVPTIIWVESGIGGEKYVMIQHDGMPPFEYAVFNYRYGYTDNASVARQAERLALALGAAEPVEHRQRPWPKDAAPA